ncbi:MAG: response regulator transcription factor [Anaerolineales bacterium]|nr:response regulator transcription factor [Anaerolineales bacterium]
MPHRPSILLVDDDPLIRYSLSIYLQDTGYSVTTAEDAQAALICLQKLTYDLILLDLVMPGMNGLELVRAIRREYPQTPVVILTAHATLESAIESLRLGVKDYLLKPVSLEETIESVNKALSDSSLQKQQRDIIQNLKNLVEKWDGVDTISTIDLKDSEPIPPTGRSKIMEWGSISVDLYARCVVVKGKPVHLSPTSFDYMVTLIHHAPQPVSHETLLLESQGFVECQVKAKEIVRWRIHQLRKAIEPDIRNPHFIITVPGVGYCLAEYTT